MPAAVAGFIWKEAEMPKGNDGWGRDTHWDFGSTSDSPDSLSRDEGGVHGNFGSISSDHAISREHTGYRRGSGFSQPSDKDFGPPDAWAGRDHLENSRGQKPKFPIAQKEGSDGSVTERPLNASTARVKRTSADEYFADSWEGYPSKRGE
jgi:hypothetical protein